MKYIDRCRVAPGSRVKLKDIDPGFKDKHESHKDATEELEQDRTKLLELQEMLYAEGRRSLLIVLQGMDTGGKDGTINHILGAMNPQGCRVQGFKQPSAEEAAHVFLWRIHPAARTSAKVRPWARAWLMNVCRPWWIVSDCSRSAPSGLQAVRNRFRKVCREKETGSRPGRSDTRNGSSGSAALRNRSSFHAARSASVPASHHSSTVRGRPPFDAPRRMRMCGRVRSTRTSPKRRWGDLAGPQPAADGQAEQDQVQAGVLRARRLALQFGQHDGQFAAGENLGWIGGPARYVGTWKTLLRMAENP